MELLHRLLPCFLKLFVHNHLLYLLTSVAKDLKNDRAYKFTQKNNDYIFTTKTNYPNNPKYVKQDITLDKKFNLKKVEVKDEQDIAYIEFKVKNIDKKAKFDEQEFNLEEITKEIKFSEDNDNNINDEETEEENNTKDTDNNINNEETEEENNIKDTDNNINKEETEETTKVNENVFPLYLPSNTTLTDKEVIETGNGERVIMTFSGDNPFILVQETVKPAEKLEIIPTYGEPFMLIDTVGSLTDTSYTWTSNGIEYYIVSDQMDRKELLEVAKSINIVSALNEK